jgi:hypothetical protein
MIDVCAIPTRLAASIARSPLARDSEIWEVQIFLPVLPRS